MASRGEKGSKREQGGQFPNPATQFKPGHNRPGPGRPKGPSLLHHLKKVARDGMEIETKDGTIHVDALKEMIDTAYRRAIKGDFRFWNAIMERMHGKVPQGIEVEGALGLLAAQSVPQDTEELEAKRDEILKRRALPAPKENEE